MRQGRDLGRCTIRHAQHNAGTSTQSRYLVLIVDITALLTGTTADGGTPILVLPRLGHSGEWLCTLLKLKKENLWLEQAYQAPPLLLCVSRSQKAQRLYLDLQSVIELPLGQVVLICGWKNKGLY